MALAKQLGATLHLLNVVDARLLIAEISAYAPPGSTARRRAKWRPPAADAAALLARSKGLAADSVVRCDPGLRVCDMILQEAKTAGAELTMGTHGRRGLKRLALGSDAELVLRESPVPVLLVRGPRPWAQA